MAGSITERLGASLLMQADLVGGQQTGRRTLQSRSRSGRAVQERREEVKPCQRPRQSMETTHSNSVIQASERKDRGSQEPCP